MKTYKQFAFIAFIAGIVCVTGTGCVAPVYHTAEVTPGTNFYVGGGPALIYQPGARPSHDYDPADTAKYYWIGRLDFQGLFGLSDRFALTAHLGSHFSNSERYEFESSDSWSFELPGLQLQTHPFIYGGLLFEFIENPSVALKLEGGIPSLVNLRLLFSPYNNKGLEPLTLGLIILPWPGISFTIQPHKLISFYLSVPLLLNGRLLPISEGYGVDAELFTMGLGFKLW